MRAETTARPVSIALDPRDRQRFVGPRLTRARCRWCAGSFAYRRHIGRPRKYCSITCAEAAHAAGRR